MAEIRKYDYRKAVYEDVLWWCEDELEHHYYDLDDLDWESEDLAQQLTDILWSEDSVTGNASGSYTMNRWQAEEFICHNLDLYDEMCWAFGVDESVRHEAEWMDVSIRCYLLGEAIEDALDTLRQLGRI